MLHCLPLWERVFRGSASGSPGSRPIFRSTPTVVDLPTGTALNVRGVYKEWPQSCMDKAIEAVIVNKVSVRCAAHMYNVPGLPSETELVGECNLVL